MWRSCGEGIAVGKCRVAWFEANQERVFMCFMVCGVARILRNASFVLAYMSG